METPLISVLLPVYKHEAYLMDAVQSIINQTYQNWELLILNDDPEKYLNFYERLDSRIEVFENDKHRGKWFQINCGIKLSAGSYIAFQDADDISMPQRFDISLKEINGNDFLYADGICLLPNGKQKYMKSDGNNLTKKPLGCQGTYFIKKSDNVPEFEKGINRGDDWIWVVKCIMAGMSMCHLSLPLYYYRDYTGNFRKNSNRLKRYLSNRRLRKLVVEIAKS